MDKKRNKLRFIIPIIALAIQLLYIPMIPYQNVKINLHWLLYIIVFVYLLLLGDIRQLFRKLMCGLHSFKFCKKTILYFLTAFAVVMVLLVSKSEPFSPVYRLWNPSSTTLLVVWVPLYIIVQPVVDHIIYYHWFIGNTDSGVAKIMIVLSATARTFAETGVLILDKNSAIPDHDFLALGLWVANIIFAVCYFNTKDEARSFLVEALYRLALVMTVLIGMPQLLVFIR